MNGLRPSVKRSILSTEPQADISADNRHDASDIVVTAPQMATEVHEPPNARRCRGWKKDETTDTQIAVLRYLDDHLHEHQSDDVSPMEIARRIHEMYDTYVISRGTRQLRSVMSIRGCLDRIGCSVKTKPNVPCSVVIREGSKALPNFCKWIGYPERKPVLKEGHAGSAVADLEMGEAGRELTEGGKLGPGQDVMMRSSSEMQNAQSVKTKAAGGSMRVPRQGSREQPSRKASRKPSSTMARPDTVTIPPHSDPASSSPSKRKSSPVRPSISPITPPIGPHESSFVTILKSRGSIASSILDLSTAASVVSSREVQGQSRGGSTDARTSVAAAKSLQRTSRPPPLRTLSHEMSSLSSEEPEVPAPKKQKKTSMSFRNQSELGDSVVSGPPSTNIQSVSNSTVHFAPVSNAVFSTGARPRYREEPFSIPEEDLETAMKTLFSDLKSFVYTELDGLQVSPQARPRFSLDGGDNGDLAEVYRHICGHGLVSARQVAIKNTMSAMSFAVACVGAFLHKNVFAMPPLESASDVVANVKSAMGLYASLIEDRSKVDSVNDATLEDTIRRVCAAAVSNTVKQQEIFGDTAHALALRLARMLQTLVDEYATGPALTRDEVEDRTLDWAGKLGPLIVRALALKAKLTSAYVNYHFEWKVAGSPFDRQAMVGTHGDGERVVATFFPGLFLDGAGRERPVYRIQVRCGP